MLADGPKSLGNHVTTASYYDTNLCNNVIVARYFAGIMYLINKTPID